MKTRALLIDLANVLPQQLSELLQKYQVESETVINETQAWKILDQEQFGIIFFGFGAANLSHMEVMKELRSRGRSASHILVVGPDQVALAVNVMQNGAFQYWSTPVTLSEIEEVFKSNLLSFEPTPSYQREETLVQIIKEIALAMDLDRLSNILMDSAMELTDADGGALLLLGEKPNSLTAKAVRGLSGNQRESEYFGLPEERYLEILNSRKAECLFHNTQAEKEQVCEIMVAPIWWKNEPLGVLVNVKYPDNARFSKDDFKLLTMLIEEISGAVYNAVTHYRTKELTIKDDLTEAYNRRYFEHYLEEEMMRARRYGSHLALIFFDVDNLKEVNMKHGHLIGSKTLQEVAHRMILTVRGIDKVVRYGGDEFCIVLPETDTQGAYQVADRIRSTISSKPFLINETIQINITGSMGIASFPTHASNKEDLVRQADLAMFVIKNKSKNAIAVAEVLAS